MQRIGEIQKFCLPSTMEESIILLDTLIRKDPFGGKHLPALHLSFHYVGNSFLSLHLRWKTIVSLQGKREEAQKSTDKLELLVFSGQIFPIKNPVRKSL